MSMFILFTQNQARNEARETLDKERQTFVQCQSAVNLINQSREMRLAEISRVQCDIKVCLDAVPKSFHPFC